MTKLQLSVLSFSVLFFCFMYFGLSKKAKKHIEIERLRSQKVESTNVSSILIDARKKLTVEQSTILHSLENKLKEVESDSNRVEILKKISSNWYANGRADLSGVYAEEIAEIVNTEETWSITGTSYLIAVQNAKQKKIKDFCSARAIKAFENAISLNPSNVDHRINLALCFVENPLANNPMKGILMLRELIEKYPENVSVINTLARLAIQTNQFERAINRLEKAISIEKENLETNCLLSQAYSGIGNTTKANAYKELCEKLRNK